MKKRTLATLLALALCLTLLPATALADREARFTYEQQVPGGTITYRSDVEYALVVSGALDSGVWYVHSCSDGVTQADILPTITIQVDGGTFSGPVEWVEGGAFNNKTKLTSVSFPNDDIEIWGGAFRGCTSLTSVTLPGGLTNIGLGAFRGTPWQEKMGDFPVVNGILLDYQGEDTSITIPDGVTGIVDRLFTENTSLTSVTIPDSVTSIGREAFKNCTGLTSVTIGNGVTSIGNEAFNGCKALTGVNIGSGVTSIGEYAFAGCKMTDVTIPSTVTDIGRGAFTKTPWLESQGDFPTANGILLEYCGKDTAVTIPENVTIIGDEVFGYNKSLTSVTIPNSVTSIRTGAFWGCDKLTSVTIPSSVTSIGGQAFSGCTNLTNITIPGSVTNIGGQAFGGCKSLTSVAIPNGVTSIEESTFDYCTSLTNATIPNSVTSIGPGAFRSCTGLTSLSIPSSVTSIGSHAFSGCAGLTGITIPNGVTSLEYGVFEDCKGLTSVTIPASVTLIGQDAFSNCTGLTSLTILSGTTRIQYASAFNGCTGLKEVYYGGTQEQWKSISMVSYNPLESIPVSYITPTTPTQPAQPQTANPTNDKLTVNGKEATPAAYKIDGANYFMLRDLAALLNGTKSQFSVGWDPAANSGTITTGQAYSLQGGELQGKPTVSATANLTKDVIYINGEKADLTIYKIGNSNYIQLRDLGRIMDFGLDYQNGTVMIDTTKPYTE